MTPQGSNNRAGQEQPWRARRGHQRTVAAAALLIGLVVVLTVPPGAEARAQTQAEAYGAGGAAQAASFGLRPGWDADAVLAAVGAVAEVEPLMGASAGVYRAWPRAGGPAALATRLRSLDGVAWAEAPRPVSAYAAPNDPQFWDQYHLLRLQVARAWETSPGSAAVTVAVVDSGVGPHPDLEGRLLPGLNLIHASTPNDTGDLNGHGTALAGIIAANVHNRTGVAGIAQRVRILPVVVLDESGVGNDQDAAAGIIWAVDQGASIVNVSLGGQWPSGALQAAVRYARDQGVVVVAAAGNDSQPGVRYPAAFPEVIAVGATDAGDEPLAYSNSGPEIDVAAPGSSIRTTGFFDTALHEPTYRLVSGTSFSSAAVAGVAALLLSRNSSLTPARVEQLLEDGCRDVGPAGWDPQTGAGRIDAASSLALLEGGSSVGDVTAPRSPDGVTTFVADNDESARVSLTVSLHADDDRAQVEVRRTAGRPARSTGEGGLVAVLDAPPGDQELHMTDDPVALGFTPGSVVYFTAFALDGVGNVSNPVWAYAYLPGGEVEASPMSPEVVSAASTFRDVESGHPFAKAIQALAAQGVVEGFSDGTFRPDATVTRAQITKMVVLALGWAPMEPAPEARATFRDVPVAPGYPYAHVEAAAVAGVVNGLSGTQVPGDARLLFGPYQPVSRVQVARMLSRAGGEKLDLPPAGIVLPFYDLADDAGEEVAPVWEMGVVRGRSATGFAPWSSATRGQVAEMLFRLETVLASRP